MNRPLLVALAFVVEVAFSQSRPDFVGSWKLNRAASEYPDPKAVPTLLIRTVEINGDDLHYTIDRELNGKKGHSDVEVHIGDPDPEARVRAQWKGSTLVVTTASTDGITQIENWELSVDHKTVVDTTVIRRSDGTEVKMRRVFDRQ